MTNEEQSEPTKRPQTDEAAGEAKTAQAPSSEEGLARALEAITAQVREVRGQLDRLLSIQLDRMKLKLRAGAFWILVVTLLGTIWVTATVAAVLYFVSGVAGGLTEAFDGRSWAGNLVAGALVLVTVLSAVAWVRQRSRKRELKKLVDKYEAREARR